MTEQCVLSHWLRNLLFFNAQIPKDPHSKLHLICFVWFPGPTFLCRVSNLMAIFHLFSFLIIWWFLSYFPNDLIMHEIIIFLPSRRIVGLMLRPLRFDFEAHLYFTLVLSITGSLLQSDLFTLQWVRICSCYCRVCGCVTAVSTIFFVHFQYGPVLNS